MAKENCYRVVWEIDIYATTAQKAAEEALRIQRDPASRATVFEVRWTKSASIDLDHPKSKKEVPR